MRKIIMFFLTIFFMALGGVVQATRIAHGSERDDNRVLLVYDSQNTIEQGEKRLIPYSEC
ncbi:hypothetical protein [Pediococcus pentosaceus]|uniref:hypothetical protein n=1 Tax=Pediococcus pentosaceus TaxID=1255 RepID=UPI0020BDA07D|nr:hypothetical protein [Pediococcus pentosaceus]MDQ7252707.1 hypothetical protein [Pediococcus pentosaceus]